VVGEVGFVPVPRVVGDGQPGDVTDVVQPGAVGGRVGVACIGVGDQDHITVWVLLGYLRRDLLGEAAAAEGWRAGLAQGDGRDISSSRAMAWLANVHAALGDEQRALSIVNDLCSREPDNGYLRYRLAYVLAELHRDDDAVDMLDQAVSRGLLSLQLARQEEILATARISASGRYCATMQRLEQRVAACGEAYARDILPVPVAATA
jgi:hypothetical protein